MTADQITALAREYAEETLKEADLPNCLSNETIDSLISEAEHKFRWLLRRFCLVEKSTVAEEYKRAIETNRKGKETGAHCLCTMGSARKTLLESLFPEIGKEVEG